MQNINQTPKNNIVGQRIEFLRTQAGLTKEELGKRLGYKSAKSIISMIESGKRGMSRKMILKAADELNCDPSFLVSEITLDKEKMNIAINCARMLKQTSKSKHYDAIKSLLELAQKE